MTTASVHLSGIQASPGIGFGNVRRTPTLTSATSNNDASPRIGPDSASPPVAFSADEEQTRLDAAIKAAADELTHIAEELRRAADPAAAAIFDAHREIVRDPELRKQVCAHIINDQQVAQAAWRRVIGDFETLYASSRSPMLQEKAADVRDAGDRVWVRLGSGQADTSGATTTSPQPPDTSGASGLPSKSTNDTEILVTDDLTPSQILQLDPVRIRGVVCSAGTAASHNAILLRNRRIPAIFGINLGQIPDNAHLAVVATSAEAYLIIDPSQSELSSLRAEGVRRQASHGAAQKARFQPLFAPDDEPIAVLANIADPTEAAAARELGAEGVGLYRTEFLYLDRPEPPSEDAQEQAYRSVLQAMHPYPVTIRTMDIGGDKPAPALGITTESNPFLGWRGIRFSLARPDLFRTQIRALVRASAHGDLRVMFPMVTTLEEWRRARTLFHEERNRLFSQGIAVGNPIPLGIMVEVPAVALCIDMFLPEVDFISIGTNDLVQYIMAADRTNARVSALADHAHPAIKQLLADVIGAARRHGKPVSLCGEMAADLAVTESLVAHGLRSFSMSADTIGQFRHHWLSLSEPNNPTF